MEEQKMNVVETSAQEEASRELIPVLAIPTVETYPRLSPLPVVCRVVSERTETASLYSRRETTAPSYLSWLLPTIGNNCIYLTVVYNVRYK